MDPFSITVGAIGISQAAIASISELRALIDGMVEARDVIDDISTNLEGITRPLETLQELELPDAETSTAAREDLKKTGLAEAVKRCGDACEGFAKNLRKWTKHSSTSNISLRDRFAVGVWNKEKIQTFRTQVQSCQKTVQFAVASTQLTVQLRSERMSETHRTDLMQQLQNRECMIQEHLHIAQIRQGETKEDIEALQQEIEDEDDGAAEQILALNEVEERAKELEAGQVSCRVIFSQIHSKRTGQEISNVLTSADSKAVIGMPESLVGQINQRIVGITTENKSAAVVGVYGGGFDINAFFN